MVRAMTPAARLVAPLLAALAAGCVTPARVALRVPAGEAPACHFRGRWSLGELRGARSGAAFAEVTDADAEGALVRESRGPSLRLVLRARGWNLLGTADLAAGSPLRPQRAVALTDLLTAHAGADVTVRDARSGEALVAPGRFAFGGDEGGLRFTTDPARWVPCGVLGFDFTFRDEHTDERERVAMGLSPGLPTREIPAAAAVDLAATAGGAPAAHVAPRDYPITVRPLGTEGSFTRVLLQHWTSFALVAWLPTAALVDGDGGGNGGLMGGLGSSERRALTVCRSPVDLTFAFAAGDGPLEYAGAVAAGTEFIRGAGSADGGFAIATYPRGASPRPARGVRWVAHAAAPLACRDAVE
jgi:hypothetical protein